MFRFPVSKTVTQSLRQPLEANDLASERPAMPPPMMATVGDGVVCMVIARLISTVDDARVSSRKRSDKSTDERTEFCTRMPPSATKIMCGVESKVRAMQLSVFQLGRPLTARGVAVCVMRVMFSSCETKPSSLRERRV
jgi:hypothetical protein